MRTTTRHYAANGRTLTACGRRCEPNGLGNKNNDSVGPFGCLECRTVLKAASKMEAAALARCAEMGNEGRSKRLAAEAKSKAIAVAKRLGPGWSIRVWENLGWHWEVNAGAVSISRTGYAFIAIYDSRLSAHAGTPQQVLYTVLEAAKNEMLGINKVFIDTNMKALGHP